MRVIVLCSVDEQDLKMDAILLHCLDHIASSAQTIKRHNEALKADSSLECPRDQGFTRPKVYPRLHFISSEE